MPPHQRTPTEAAASRRKRLILLALLGLFCGGIVLVLGARAAVISYLRSDRFRSFVTQKAGATLHADTSLAPLNFSGLNVYSEVFDARGGEDAAFSGLRFENVRAELSLRRFFERVWQVEQLEIQRLDLDLTGPRAVLAKAPAAAPSERKSSSGTGWLPNRVEVGTTLVRDTNFHWKGGALTRTSLNITPAEGGWNVDGRGGQIAQSGLPELDVQTLQARYRWPSLFVQRAEFRQATGGALTANGEVRFGERLDLHAKLDGIGIAPFLSEDWRVRLTGNVSGEVAVRDGLPLNGSPALSGTLSLAQGELKALPVLDEIALFTRTQQFRRLTLTRATAKFDQDRGRLRVNSLVAESEGLIRMEGSFSVENSLIDGAFQVGVTPASLQWLPGSQAQVFTEARGGYLWAPMRLTGPLAKPTEDLSPRLIAAAQGAVIEHVESTVRETLKTGKDALKGALDLLLPRK